MALARMGLPRCQPPGVEPDNEGLRGRLRVRPALRGQHRLIERPVRTSSWRPRVLLPALALAACCVTLTLFTTLPVAGPVDARHNGPIVTGSNAP